MGKEGTTVGHLVHPSCSSRMKNNTEQLRKEAVESRALLAVMDLQHHYSNRWGEISTLLRISVMAELCLGLRMCSQWQQRNMWKPEKTKIITLVNRLGFHTPVHLNLIDYSVLLNKLLTVPILVAFLSITLSLIFHCLLLAKRWVFSCIFQLPANTS